MGIGVRGEREWDQGELLDAHGSSNRDRRELSQLDGPLADDMAPKDAVSLPVTISLQKPTGWPSMIGRGIESNACVATMMSFDFRAAALWSPVSVARVHAQRARANNMRTPG